MINYVTDERGLNYKMLPSKTLSCSHEKSAPSLKKKEKVNMFAAMHLDSINYPKSAKPWAPNCFTANGHTFYCGVVRMLHRKITISAHLTTEIGLFLQYT